MSGLGDTDMNDNVENTRRPLWRRSIGFISGLGVLTAFCLIVFLAIGFVRFANLVNSMENDVNLAKADGIVVLTGGKNRISTAISLLQENKGSRLLISGVHPDAGRKSIARIANVNRDILDCCVDIDHLAMDTKGNASQTANWAAKNNFSKLIVVTSNYHMPRSLLELRTLMPKMQLIPHVVTSKNADKKAWYSNPSRLKVLLSEYAKYIAASFRKDLDRVDKTLATYASADSS